MLCYLKSFIVNDLRDASLANHGGRELSWGWSTIRHAGYILQLIESSPTPSSRVAESSDAGVAGLQRASNRLLPGCCPGGDHPVRPPETFDTD